MTRCSIYMCGARKNKIQPDLTLHKVPKNVRLRKKWLDIIGAKNINTCQKDLYVCSLHFEERCFNRTLNVARLRDDSFPTIMPHSLPASPEMEICDSSSFINDGASTSAANFMYPLPDEVQKKYTLNRKIEALKEKCMKQRKKMKCLHEIIRRRNMKISKMKNMIVGLQQRNQTNKEQAVQLEGSVGPQDCLKRRVLKSKELPPLETQKKICINFTFSIP